MAARKDNFYQSLLHDNQHPNMDADPVRWEKTWAEDLKRRWSGTGKNTKNFATELPPNATQIWCSERYLVDLQNMTRELLLFQTRLAQDAAEVVPRRGTGRRDGYILLCISAALISTAE